MRRGDVVRLPNGMSGVVLRIRDGSACVVPKGHGFGVWYQVDALKRIGRARGKNWD